MDASHDSETLYHACAQDGSDAQIDAFTQLWEQLYRIAHRMLHSYPDPHALAADCAQTALIKVHRHLAQCHDPRAFRGWAAQIVRRTVLDAVRQASLSRTSRLLDAEPALAALVVEQPGVPDDLASVLLSAISHGPLSERSRRVVLGRFFGEQTDDALAQSESQASGQTVLPSHIQVTRSKNLAKLRGDPALIEQLHALLER